MSGSATECGDHGLPHSGPVRLYPRGWCCALHTPAALAGRPEPPPGPGWPSAAWINLTDPDTDEGQEQG
ncbi:hypothetical protein ACIBJC_15125 [Streptomyces sp. NPDC050509]|uniref:hypothetical protein n=1 Tax=Streptomyces sp. NPDC050509 TaxID=3365620 RepID=UPI0037A2E916